MTYFLGLVQTTQRYTRGVSWLFITSNSPLSIFQSLHRSVVGSNTTVRDNNTSGRAGCKRKLVSWAECKFPVRSGLYFVLVWAARSPSLTCSRLQSYRGPWHGTAPDCMLCYWSRLLSVCVYRLERRRRRGGGLSHSLSHTHTCRGDVDCAASGYCGGSCEKIVVIHTASPPSEWVVTMWGRKCSSGLDEREGRGIKKKGEAPVRRIGSSLPRCQVYVNHVAVQFQTYLSSGGR